MYHENIRAFSLLIINATLFVSSWTIKDSFISVVSRAGCYKIESNIVNCRMYLVAKKKVKIKIQNEKLLEADMDIWYQTY